MKEECKDCAYHDIALKAEQESITGLEAALAEWYIKKYGRGDINIPATLRKLGEECGELMEAVMIGDPARISEEAVDVLFVMTHIVRHFAGVGQLGGFVQMKLREIYKRLDRMEGKG